MGWNDFYQRRGALLAVLEWYARNPGSTIRFDEIPGLHEAYRDREDLLRALHCRWLLLLAPRIELALDAAARHPSLDRVVAVTRAWRELAASEPALRGVLDEYAGVNSQGVCTAWAAEHRLLALAAGLAEPDQAPEEVIRIGAAFLTMVGHQGRGRCVSRRRGLPATLLREGRNLLTRINERMRRRTTKNQCQ
ncbi:hypothetical protein GCM10012275_63690 [Longimycelium tulufanense]|uniref:Uncharacterized protein n=1 Tax=Longimycelium tulufanense TaxID=907463 RepID=A0A8J3CLP8_9PSEU|nr:hypothetical protein [Longimycelium tulufanense]GGM84281.1 hypothetical protein GCM10012275_63690 [Longimycelium tulufanense]